MMNRLKYADIYIKYNEYIQEVCNDVKSKSDLVFDDINNYIPDGYIYERLAKGYVEVIVEKISHNKYSDYFYINSMLKNKRLHTYVNRQSEANKLIDETLDALKLKYPNELYIGYSKLEESEPWHILLPIIHANIKDKDQIYFLRLDYEDKEINEYHRLAIFDSIDLTTKQARHDCDLYTEEELIKRNERLHL